MKIFLILTFIFSTVAFSKDLTMKERADRSSLSIRLANYTTQTAKMLQASVMDDIQTLSTLELDPKLDLPLVKNALLTLIVLEDPVDGDPSRTAVQILSQSYSKNEKIYLEARKQIKTAKKKELAEIMKVLKSFYSEGNG